jgi:serine/threonine protein kinase/Tfp pilus assembly protein PilF
MSFSPPDKARGLPEEPTERDFAAADLILPGFLEPEEAARPPVADLALTLGSLVPPSSEPRGSRDATATPRLDSLDTGHEFAGYRLLLALGKGGAGKVFLAEEKNLARRLVVVKLSSRQLAEPYALAKLQHTHIVPIYSLHDDVDARLQAIVMPYLGGITLDCLLRRLPSPAVQPLLGKHILNVVDEQTDRVYQELARQEGMEEKRLGPLSSARGDGARGGPHGTPSRPHAPASPRSVHLPILPTEQPRDVLGRLTYERAIQWIGAKIAEALFHAHSRGLLHRDVKPGNILLAADGRPMLLDFHLAADKWGDVDGKYLGGTLPYMAPEHLEAFATEGEAPAEAVDERSDIYSLGVVLFELLTGRHPFKPVLLSPRSQEGIAALVRARRAGAPSLRTINPRISPSLEAAVRKCLEPCPEKRYRSAWELAEDLNRDLNHLPLRHTQEPDPLHVARKWVARHPRLVAILVVLTLSTMLLSAAALVMAGTGRKLAELDRREQLQRFQQLFLQCQILAYAAQAEPTREALQQARAKCRSALRFLHEDMPEHLVTNWAAQLDQQTREMLVELQYVLASLYLAEATLVYRISDRQELYQKALQELRRGRSYGDDVAPRALFELETDLHHLLGQESQARKSLQRAEKTPLRGPRDYYLLATRVASRGDHRRAVQLYQRALQQQPNHFWALFGLAVSLQALKEYDAAQATYVACLLLWPDFPWVYINRGQTLVYQGRYEEALADFNRAIALAPSSPAAYEGRGFALLKLGRWGDAEQDFTVALERGRRVAELYLARATSRLLQEKLAEAMTDLEAAWNAEPHQARTAVAAAALLVDAAPEEAMAWAERALAVEPTSAEAHFLKGYLMAEKFGIFTEGLTEARLAVSLQPCQPRFHSLVALLLARRGDASEALAHVGEALRAQPSPEDYYALASALACLSTYGETFGPKACELLGKALEGGFDIRRARLDRDFQALHTRPCFQAVMHRAVEILPASASAAVPTQPPGP